MTEPGDTTPISDEAGEYVIDHGWLCEVHNEHTCGVAKNDPVHEPGCGLEPIARVEELLRALSAAPLLVSAEAERRGDSDELLAAAAHESSEDRRLAALMVEPRNRAVLERRAEVTERLAAEVEGLRAELAAEKRKRQTVEQALAAAATDVRSANEQAEALRTKLFALRAAGGQEKPTGEIVCREHNRPGRYCSVDGLGCDGMERADAAREAEDECEHRWDSIGPHRVCTVCDISATSFYGVPFDEHEAPAAAPVGGQAEPSDAQIDADLALDGFDPKDRYPEHGHDALRTAYRSGWESAGIAAAAVSGEQAQPDGDQS